jgi:hypothetical protein
MITAISHRRKPRGDRDRTPVRSGSASSPSGWRRSGTSPVATGARPAAPAAADEDDCALRPDRWRARARRPPLGVSPQDRECTCTTALRPGFVGLREPNAQRRCVPGCARSSRQAVSALGATCLQHGSPGAGAHAVTEAVLFGTTTVVRLVGALHATLLGCALMANSGFDGK